METDLLSNYIYIVGGQSFFFLLNGLVDCTSTRIGIQNYTKIIYKLVDRLYIWNTFRRSLHLFAFALIHLFSCPLPQLT